MFELLETLDPQQRAVAQHGTTPLRVLAGAGTGKTTALTGRAAHLATGCNVAADRILMLTFTRRAARQMVGRTATLIGRVQETSKMAHTRSRVVGGTFHSVAHQTLRRHASAMGLSEGFGVIDPSDAGDLIDVIRSDVLRDQPLRRRFPKQSTLLDIYSRAVDTATPVSEVLVKVAPWAAQNSDDIIEICRAFVSRKRSLGVLDFDDLLLYWREALRHPLVGPELARQYDHVLVDEYQDVNALQVEILQLLAQHGPALTAVGDDAQAIYSFRASSPDHILNFSDDFSGSETISLTTNYRSAPKILAVANAIARGAPRGFSTILEPCTAHRDVHSEPRLIRCADEDGQSDAVCERILELREAGTALREQAVLVRAAHHSDRLEIELTRRGIPFVKYGGLKYLEAAHVKDLLAAFRIADNPRDELSWFRILQLLPGVGPSKARQTIKKLGLDSDSANPSPQLTEILARWPSVLTSLPEMARDAANALVEALAPEPDDQLVIHATRLCNAVAPLIEGHYQDAEARLVDLDALVQATTSMKRLSEVAAEHALEPPVSTGDLAGPPTIDEDFIVISTVHSAKGLEWDSVHVIHAADGNFPSDMALTDTSGLDEERRLFYVALTRARKSLDIYVPLRFHVNRHAHNDRHIWAQPSRFVTGEIAKHLADITHLRPTDFGATAFGANSLPAADAGVTVDTHLNALWS